jgi:hypothetical protein
LLCLQFARPLLLENYRRSLIDLDLRCKFRVAVEFATYTNFNLDTPPCTSQDLVLFQLANPGEEHYESLSIFMTNNCEIEGLYHVPIELDLFWWLSGAMPKSI